MSKVTELRGVRVAVVGLGKSGLSAARLLLREGAQVSLFDEKPLDALSGARELLAAHPDAIRLHAGSPFSEGPLLEASLVVVSPGVPLAHPTLKRVRAAGVPLMGEVELAYRFLPHDVPWVGVTGTNGKSTTTALTGELFRQARLRPFVGGNLGTPLSDAALSAEAYGAFVIELSSYQLEAVDQFRAKAAAVLNLTPDHLDRYPGLAEYGAAKAEIFKGQRVGDAAVVNADDAEVVALSQRARVPVYGFTLRAPQDRTAAPDSPGAGASGGKWAGLAVPTESGFAFDFGAQARFTLNNPALRGPHNLQNAMAAALLGHLQGLSGEVIQKGLDAFPGLPNRLESLGRVNGVEWVNDSKATNVNSAVVGLNAFPHGRVWLIAGGKGKGAPYSPLRDAARGRVVAVLTVGQDAPNLVKALAPEFEVVPCGTLARAVEVASLRAEPGDVVLLSPACASLDQFQSFEHRGNVFRELVQNLKRGQATFPAGPRG
jgi:UDP-N-acetylmuramoylalanine--D-glutamate ligase